MHLKVSSEDSSKRCKQLTSLLGTVKLIEGVDEAELRGTELVLVNCALEELVVTEDDITLFLAKRTPLCRREL